MPGSGTEGKENSNKELIVQTFLILRSDSPREAGAERVGKKGRKGWQRRRGELVGFYAFPFISDGPVMKSLLALENY